MIKIKHGEISDVMFYNYLTLLIDKIFKILPMKENKVMTLPIYLDSLQTEIIGCMSLFPEFRNEANFITLLSKIQFLSDSESSVEIYKREIFNMINIVEKIQSTYFISNPKQKDGD